MGTQRKPSRRQRRVFDWITAYIQRNNLAPTVMDVAGGLKISCADAINICRDLRGLGYLEVVIGTAPRYQPAPVCPNCGGRIRVQMGGHRKLRGGKDNG